MEDWIMGSWGYKALDSDNGLDVIDFLEDNIPKDYNLKLSKIISQMKGKLLGKDFDDIDFLYDNTVMALAELYFNFKDKRKLNYKNEDDKTKSLTNIISFSANKSSLNYLLKILNKIKKEIPNENTEHEIILLWKDSKEGYWKKWERHLNKLIERLIDEINNLE
jgi:hypothetical protein